jgi:hypothetical protein
MKPKELQDEGIAGIIQAISKLLIYNSNHFWDDVVLQLQKATGYDLTHCEQIAIIAHTKGKAVVKSGNIDDLLNIDKVLKEINLVTEIE